MPYYNREPERDHNFDNHPYQLKDLCSLAARQKGKNPRACTCVRSPENWGQEQLTMGTFDKVFHAYVGVCRDTWGSIQVYAG